MAEGVSTYGLLAATSEAVQKQRKATLYFASLVAASRPAPHPPPTNPTARYKLLRLCADLNLTLSRRVF